jgi:hypothetical protein
MTSSSGAVDRLRRAVVAAAGEGTGRRDCGAADDRHDAQEESAGHGGDEQHEADQDSGRPSTSGCAQTDAVVARPLRSGPWPPGSVPAGQRVNTFSPTP